MKYHYQLFPFISFKFNLEQIKQAGISIKVGSDCQSNLDQFRLTWINSDQFGSAKNFKILYTQTKKNHRD